uniref:Transposase n=1 Tax=Macrostomum lignano TaxID=282301 RepID=A0A1I8FCW0_9PLAT
ADDVTADDVTADDVNYKSCAGKLSLRRQGLGHPLEAHGVKSHRQFDTRRAELLRRQVRVPPAQRRGLAVDRPAPGAAGPVRVCRRPAAPRQSSAAALPRWHLSGGR